MNILPLSFRDIEYIVAVADELHFGKAAHRLHVSQPTLSEQIKKVENMLGIIIFERTKRSVQVTPQGMEFITTGKLILTEAQKFHQLSLQKKSPLSGPFHLGAIATLGPYYLPYLIGPLRKAYPQLELIISEGQTYELLNKLDKGELDAIIASRTFDESKYRIYTLFKEPFWLASPHDSSLYHNTKVKPIRTKDIDKDKIILLADGNCLKDEVVDFCQLSRTQTYKLQASSLETLKHLIAAGNGISFFPELAIEENKKLNGLITYSEIAEKSAFREIVLVTREQFSRPESIRALLAIIKKNLPQFKSQVAIN